LPDATRRLIRSGLAPLARSWRRVSTNDCLFAVRCTSSRSGGMARSLHGNRCYPPRGTGGCGQLRNTPLGGQLRNTPLGGEPGARPPEDATPPQLTQSPSAHPGLAILRTAIPDRVSPLLAGGGGSRRRHGRRGGSAAGAAAVVAAV